MVYFQLQKKYLWHLVSKLLETSKEFWWFIGFFFIHLLLRRPPVYNGSDVSEELTTEDFSKLSHSLSQELKF